MASISAHFNESGSDFIHWVSVSVTRWALWLIFWCFFSLDLFIFGQFWGYTFIVAIFFARPSVVLGVLCYGLGSFSLKTACLAHCLRHLFFIEGVYDWTSNDWRSNDWASPTERQNRSNLTWPNPT
jgi:hypothetical protein